MDPVDPARAPDARSGAAASASPRAIATSPTCRPRSAYKVKPDMPGLKGPEVEALYAQRTRLARRQAPLKLRSRWAMMAPSHQIPQDTRRRRSHGRHRRSRRLPERRLAHGRLVGPAEEPPRRGVQRAPPDVDAAARALAEFDVVCVMRERMPFPRALFEKLPKLRLLVTTGKRNASIDMAAAADHKVDVCGTAGGYGGGSGLSTAELTIALMLAWPAICARSSTPCVPAAAGRRRSASISMGARSASSASATSAPRSARSAPPSA